MKAHYKWSIRTCILQEDALYGTIGTCLLQECTLYAFKKDLSHKKARYIGSISTCLLQEGTLYGVSKDLCLRGKHVIRSKRTLLLQEDTLYWVNKDLPVTRKHVLLLLGNWRYFVTLFFSCSGLAKSVSKLLYVFKYIVPQTAASSIFVTESGTDLIFF